MNSLKWSFLGAVLLSACASFGPDARTCNYQTAYEHGVNAARADEPMDSGFFSYCPDDVRDRALLGYREGYLAGQKMPKKSAAPAPVATPYGAPVSAPLSGEKSYYCKLEKFMDKFDAFGPTELETKIRVRKACEAKNSELMCRDEKITCQRNE